MQLVCQPIAPPFPIYILHCRQKLYLKHKLNNFFSWIKIFADIHCSGQSLDSSLLYTGLSRSCPCLKLISSDFTIFCFPPTPLQPMLQANQTHLHFINKNQALINQDFFKKLKRDTLSLSCSSPAANLGNLDNSFLFLRHSSSALLSGKNFWGSAPQIELNASSFSISILFYSIINAVAYLPLNDCKLPRNVLTSLATFIVSSIEIEP